MNAPVDYTNPPTDSPLVVLPPVEQPPAGFTPPPWPAPAPAPAPSPAPVPVNVTAAGARRGGRGRAAAVGAVVVAVGVSLAWGVSSYRAAGSWEDRAGQLATRLEASNAELSATLVDLDETKTELSGAGRDLAGARADLAEVNKKVAGLEDRVGGLAADKADLTDQGKQLKILVGQGRTAAEQMTACAVGLALRSAGDPKAPTQQALAAVCDTALASVRAFSAAVDTVKI